MHEASLVRTLLRQVAELVAAQGGERAVSVNVEVGPLAGVEPLLLQEAFEHLRRDTVASEAALEIEYVPLTLRCRKCGHPQETIELRFQCGRCQSQEVDVVGGDAVVLRSVTIAIAEASSSL